LFLVAAAACCSRCSCAPPRTNAPAPLAGPPAPPRCCAPLAIAWAVSVVLLRELALGRQEAGHTVLRPQRYSPASRTTCCTTPFWPILSGRSLHAGKAPPQAAAVRAWQSPNAWRPPAENERGAALGVLCQDVKHVLTQAALKQEVVLGGRKTLSQSKGRQLATSMHVSGAQEHHAFSNCVFCWALRMPG
jgi:hypothetical protein